MISIIVPIYNAETFIHRCVDSILSQTYKDIEIILVDDGSKDTSGIICDDYASKNGCVKVIHKENGGVSSARNAGLDMAKGEWIAFVDADDWISPNMYELMIEKAVDAVELVFCDYYLCYKSFKKEYNISLSKRLDKMDFLRYEMVYGWTSVWNMLIKRSLMVDNCLRFADIRYSEDFIIFVKLILLAKSIGYINSSLYYYNRSNESSALHRMPFDAYKELIFGEKTIIEFFKKQNVFELYKKQMYWRVLRDKQELILRINKHREFLEIYPESHKYILSCPLINRKLKLLMCLLVHRMGFGVKLMIRLRDTLKRGG